MPARIIARISHLAMAVLRRMGMRWQTWLYRACLQALGPGSRIAFGVGLRDPGRISIGEGCALAAGVAASAEKAEAFLRIGDRVQINRRVVLDYTGGLRIGDDALISEQAVIYTHDHGLDPRSIPVACPKVIGAGAWIGMRAVILPGCALIGPGAVVGAGAVVTRDVPAGAIVAGNPARVIGQRKRVEAVA